jgi:hypothetical protein
MNIGKIGVYTGLKTIANPNLDEYSGRKDVSTLLVRLFSEIREVIRPSGRLLFRFCNVWPTSTVSGTEWEDTDDLQLLMATRPVAMNQEETLPVDFTRHIDFRPLWACLRPLESDPRSSARDNDRIS